MEFDPVVEVSGVFRILSLFMFESSGDWSVGMQSLKQICQELHYQCNWGVICVIGALLMYWERYWCNLGVISAVEEFPLTLTCT